MSYFWCKVKIEPRWIAGAFRTLANTEISQGEPESKYLCSFICASCRGKKNLHWLLPCCASELGVDSWNWATHSRPCSCQPVLSISLIVHSLNPATAGAFLCPYKEQPGGLAKDHRGSLWFTSVQCYRLHRPQITTKVYQNFSLSAFASLVTTPPKPLLCRGKRIAENCMPLWFLFRDLQRSVKLSSFVVQILHLCVVVNGVASPWSGAVDNPIVDRTNPILLNYYARAPRFRRTSDTLHVFD